MVKIPTQLYRNMAIATSLGEDVLLLDSFTYTEDFSNPYRLTAIVSSAKPKDVAIEETIGNAATIRVARKDKKTRYFGGIVVKVIHDARVKERPRYELTIVPKLWLLSRNSDCRVFQKKSVPEIIKQVFSDRGISDSLSDKLKGKFEKRDYTVQYRESDFNFLSRLMEMEGIYYYHTHDKNGKHQTVLSDDPSCHEALDGYAELPFQLPGAGVAPDRISDWRVETEIQTEKVTLKAFDFKAPNVKPKETKTLDYPSKWAAEIFDYPVEFHLPAEVKRHAQLRAEEIAAGAMRYTGRTDCRGICCGGKFTLTDPLGQLRKNQAKEYLIIGVNVHGAAAEFSSGSSGGAAEEFACSFTCTQAKKVFRPARTTPKPVVAGAQTATVVGPKGKHIYTDKHGRVKLQFHWDRKGTFDENSSCWIRVSQAWAGQGWGGLSIPRTGQEVIVEFLEGDPDRPLVTGRVYNDQNKAPFPLPDSCNISGMRSDTVGTNGGGYNEVAMDDSPGKEKLNLQAQYDMATLVKHDQSLTVQNNRSISVTGTHTETIKKDTKVSVTEGTGTYYVNKAVLETYDDTQTTVVKKAIGIASTDADIDIGAKTMINLHSGSCVVNLKKDGEVIDISAATTICIHVGDCQIKLESNGTISISAKKINIMGQQETVIGVASQTVTSSPAKLALSGAAIASSAVGTHEITGAVVKIN